MSKYLHTAGNSEPDISDAARYLGHSSCSARRRNRANTSDLGHRRGGARRIWLLPDSSPSSYGDKEQGLISNLATTDSSSTLDTSLMHPRLAAMHPLWTAGEAATMLGMSEASIYTIRHNFPEKLPCDIKLSDGKSSIRYPNQQLMAWCQNRRRNTGKTTDTHHTRQVAHTPDVDKYNIHLSPATIATTPHYLDWLYG